MNPKYQQLIDNYHNAAIEVSNYIPDAASVDEMERRIKEHGRSAKGVIFYSELVSGIPFRQRNLYGANPHFIDPGSWEGNERKMVGTALADIAVRNLPEADCLITSIVVLKNNFIPSKTFFDWLSWSGLLDSNSEAAIDAFWVEEFRKALAYFRRP